MKKLFFLAVMSVVGFTAVAQADATEVQADEVTITVTQDFEEISISDLPEAVSAALAKDYPTATIDKAYKNASDQYKLDLSLEDGTTGTLYADAEGNWIQL
ncbi:hypothetical protein [uncultured Croceitalea sp.]|uniref:hypothetical protein n=1 Tax=uncultured Croceitalea sp. TaxID=1798908 RepID=UPI00330640A4